MSTRATAFVSTALALVLTACQDGSFRVPGFSELGGGETAADAGAAGGSAADNAASAQGGRQTRRDRTGAGQGDATVAGSADDDGTEATAGEGSESTAEAGYAFGGDPSVPANRKEDVETDGTEPHAWTDAQVGWMTRTEMQGGVAMIQEVVEAEDRLLLMQTTTSMNGNVVQQGRAWMPRWYRKVDVTPVEEVETEHDVVTEQLADESVTVDEESVDCEVHRTILRSGGQTITSITWMSKEVPGWIVRSDTDAAGSGMQTVARLVEFRR